MRSLAIARALAFGTCAGVAAAAALASCGGKVSHDAGPGTSSLVPALVPAPVGLVLDVSMRDLDAAWGRLQRGVGGALAILPSTLAEFACDWAGIDGSVAPMVDGHGAAFAVFAGPVPLRWVVALPLAASARGENPVLADVDARALAPGLAALQAVPIRTRPTAAFPATVAVAPRWLFVASDAEALGALGPYAVRARADGIHGIHGANGTPGAAPQSPASIVAVVPASAVAAIAGALAPAWTDARTWLLARDRDERLRHDGRAPDFADSAALLATVDAVVGQKLAWLGAARAVTLEVDTGDDDLHADVRVTPAADAPPAGHPGDAAPLRDVPIDSPFALLVRDDVEGRAAGARDVTAAAATVLGPRLPDASKDALATALDDWARGRGDWMTVVLTRARIGAPGVALALRTPVSDGARASRAVHELLRLSHRAPFVEPLATFAHVRPPVLVTQGVADGAEGPINRAAFAPVGLASPLEVTWYLAAGELGLTGGPAEKATRAGSVPRTPEGAHLGDDAQTALALAALGTSATFTLVAQPLRLLPPGPRGVQDPGAPAPLVLAWGQREGDAWVRIDLADALLTAAVRSGGGFF